jgi:uncharacterized membrane protein
MDFKFLLLALLIGFASGLRTMTGLAVLSWTIHLGWLDLDHTRAARLGSLVGVILLTVGAIGEFIGDKLPRTGSRTAVGPLIARMLAGAFCGAVVGVASAQSWQFGAAFGAGGAILGAFSGYYARTGLVRALQTPDVFVAAPEDFLAIGLAVLVAFCL